MTHGRYRKYFWSGLTLSAIAGACCPGYVLLTSFSFAEPLPQLPEILGIASVPLVLTGLLLHEQRLRAGRPVSAARLKTWLRDSHDSLRSLVSSSRWTFTGGGSGLRAKSREGKDLLRLIRQRG